MLAKRALSSFVSFTLVLSMVPCSAFAATGNEDASSNTAAVPATAVPAETAAGTEVLAAPADAVASTEDSSSNEASAASQKQSEPSLYTFSDKESSIKVEVKTSDPDEAEQLKGASLKVKKLADHDLQSAVSMLGEHAVNKQVKAYSLELLSSDVPLSFEKADDITIWLPKQDSGSVYAIEDNAAHVLDGTQEDGLCKVKPKKLSWIAIVSDKDEASEAGADTEEAASSEGNSRADREAHNAPAVLPAAAPTASALAAPVLALPTVAPAPLLAPVPSDENFANIPAPVSSAQLAPGTYTVSANVSMFTPIGIYGHTANPFNPEGIGGNQGVPRVPAVNNATLVVKQDGSRTLTVNLVNPVFTVQKVESSDGVTVQNVVRVPIEKKENDDWYNTRVTGAGVDSRISQLTLSLNNWSGSYQFNNWQVYATTLNTFFPNSDWESFTRDKNLSLSLDLAHAVKWPEGDFEKTYTDEATGVSVAVKASKESASIASLTSASLKVSCASEESTEYASVSNALLQRYVAKPEFKLYNVQLVSNGTPISLDDQVTAKVTMPNSYEEAEAYYFGAGAPKLLDAAVFDAGKVSFSCAEAGQRPELGFFALANTKTATKYLITHSVSDPVSHASISYASDATRELAFYGPNSAKTTEEAAGLFKGVLDLGKNSPDYAFSDKAPDSFTSKVKEAAASEGVLTPAVDGTYAINFALKLAEDFPPLPIFTTFSVEVAKSWTFTAGTNPLSASVPVASSRSSVYLVYGTQGNGPEAAKKLKATISNGFAQVSLNDEDTGVPQAFFMLFHAATNTSEDFAGPIAPDTKIAYLAVVNPANTPVKKPVAQTGLVYNGKEQVGVAPGEGYTLTSNTATEPGSYTALATLKEGYEWEGGSTSPVTIAWSIARAPQVKPEALAPGTYTVTANLSMPGQYNPLIKGLTVYANSPDNPFGPTIDENIDVDVQKTVPMYPKSMNAQIVVAQDGTATLVLPIRNPIFTTQAIGTCSDLPDVRVERVKPTANGGQFSGSYNAKPDRIHMMAATLPKGTLKGTATFDFAGSMLYAVPLNRVITPAGNTALQLTVDYDSMKKASDSTELPEFAKSKSDSGKTENAGKTPKKPQSEKTPESGAGSNASGSDAGDEIASDNGHLAAGTYTVSANIWVNREEAGLPLSPHFTNAGFPPSTSVSKNATLTVYGDGHAYVKIPICIQSKIMHVQSILGLDIVDSSYDDEGGLTSITVDLGILKDTSRIVRTATAHIRLGYLAKTIIGGEEERTWSVTFEVVFNGAPTQTGGTLPAAAKAILDAQGADGRAVDGDANAEAAASSALSVLDSKSAPAKKNSKSSKETEAVNVAAIAGAVATVVVVGAGASFYVFRRKKLLASAPQGENTPSDV